MFCSPGKRAHEDILVTGRKVIVASSMRHMHGDNSPYRTFVQRDVVIAMMLSYAAEAT